MVFLPMGSLTQTLPGPFSFVISTDDVDWQMPTASKLWDGVTDAVYDYYVDWGDGTAIDHITSWNQAETNHSYFGLTGDYVVTITGRMDIFRMSDALYVHQTMLTDLLSWGDVGIKEYLEMFYDCIHLTYSATDAPVLDTGTTNSHSLRSMFYNTGTGFAPGGTCTGDFSSWDTSTITDFQYMFRESAWDPTGVGAWDVTAGEFFGYMFDVMPNFNQDISAWTPVNAVAAYPWSFNSMMSTTSSWSDANYDLLLEAWSLLTFAETGLDFECSAQYTATAARAILTGAPNNWTIIDNGPA